jgi:undecaprenyl-diphosphatase
MKGGHRARRAVGRWRVDGTSGARRLWRAEIALLVAAGVAFLAFAAVAAEVAEGETRAFDRAVLLSMRVPGDPSQPVGPPWVQEIGRDLTALGGVALGSMFTAASAGYLWLAERRRPALLLLGAILSGEALGTALKAIFHRPRPELVAHLVAVRTSSFPSGHSMMSAIALLTAGALLARAAPRRRAKAFVMSWAIALTLLTGISRVYLGVHWPTDVVAGWLAGAGWAAVCWAIAGRLERLWRLPPGRDDARRAGAAAAGSCGAPAACRRE